MGWGGDGHEEERGCLCYYNHPPVCVRVCVCYLVFNSCELSRIAIRQRLFSETFICYIRDPQKDIFGRETTINA